jgi:uncharacterized protein
MEITRYIKDKILKSIQPNKVIILLGARRVGKTSLIKQIMKEISEPILFLNGDDYNTKTLFEKRSVANFKLLLGNYKFLVIDEAQEIDDIGFKLKLMIDSFEGLKIIATGSSAFDLTSKVGAPLVGRNITFHLYSIAQLEYKNYENYFETISNLEERLILGSYPELLHIQDFNEKKEYLEGLINDYLLKDILAFEGLLNRNSILNLLKMIAYRIGSEISLESIGNELGMSKNTVEKYLDLFSKVFIIYRLDGFSRNLDNELTKKSKWYFWDLGIRNAVIGNFNYLANRDDIGILWENYLHSERKKKISYLNNFTSDYFWRTHTKQEIDRIEEKNGIISGFEFKWNNKVKVKTPPQFQKGYPEATFEIINKENYLDFIS